MKTTAGRPDWESQQEGLLEAIFSIVIPESFADDRQRSEVYNSVRSLDNLKVLRKRKALIQAELQRAIDFGPQTCIIKMGRGMLIPFP